MGNMERVRCTGAAMALAFVISAAPDVMAQRGGGRPGGESFGNNLSFPVIWAEGATKVLRGAPGMTPMLDGSWWWWWGTDPVSDSPLSCAPDPDNLEYCDDGIPGTYDPNALPGAGAIQVFLQKDELNVWQAGTVAPPSGGLVLVDKIDWGDNLESVDWTIRSQVRTEVVLIEDLLAADPVEPPGWEPSLSLLQYGMRHVSGWGINEVHGLATPNGQPETITPSPEATVYSHCARLTIQRLLVERDDPDLANLYWVPRQGWMDPEGTRINPPIFNGAVWEGADGPGYYSAEINVKGKVIYGYTWNVRQNNDGVGDYRITFSFDTGVPNAPLNTYFADGVTTIVQPIEEEESAIDDEGGTEGGATAVIDTVNNLTYIDVRIVGNTGGGGGGGKKR